MEELQSSRKKKWLNWLKKMRGRSLQVQPDDSKLVKLAKNSGFCLFLIFMSLITLSVVTAVTVVL